MKRYIPPLNALKAFEAAARHGSFRDAAQELNVSHSAISHQVKHLEVVLGVDLFVRKARAVELTFAGKSYYPLLRDAFDRIADATNTLLKPKTENVLTVQMYSTFAVRWLMPRMNRLNEDHPDLQVRLLTSQQDPDFELDDIDLGLYIGPRMKTDLHYELLFSPYLFPVCSPQLLEGDKAIRTPADLAKHRILQVYPSEKDWYAWLGDNRIEGVDPENGLRFDSYDHSLAAAIRGLGVALGMDPYVDEDIESGLLVCPFPELKTRAHGSWYLIYPKDRERIKKISVFRDWIVQEIDRDPVTRALRAAS